MPLRGPTREEVAQTLEVSREALRSLYRSRLPQMAAALSYRTIFGLVPALVVALVVLKSFATSDDITDILNRVLNFSGISQIVIEEDAAPGEDQSSGEQGAPVDSAAADGSPDAGQALDGAGGSEEAAEGSQSAQRLDEWIEDIVEQIGSLKLRTIGIIGVGLLVYAAISMLVEVERAFNQIYHARAGRSWTRRIMQYWTTLTLGAVVLLGSFYLGEWFRSWVGSMTAASGVTLTIVGFLTTVLMSMLLLMFLYTTLPNTRVQKSSAIAGAFVAAVLWETGKWGFTRYIGYSVSFERLYGQMALLPLFLLWVYLTWLIVLFGLKISFGLQHFSEFRDSMDEADEDLTAFVDPLSVVAVVAAVGRAFAAGETLKASEVAQQAGVPIDAALRLLSTLEDAHVLNRVSGSEATYALARPADQIDAADLVAIGQRMVSEPAHDRTRGFYEDLQARTRQLVAGRTVASLVTKENEDAQDSPSRDAADGGGQPGADDDRVL